MVRTRGRCPRGDRLVDYAPHGHWKTISFIAGLRHDKMVAPFAIEGAMNGDIFLAYIEQCLAPTLQPGDIVIMDNVATHKVNGVAEAIEAVGATLRYFPSTLPISTPSSRRSVSSKRCCAKLLSVPCRCCAEGSENSSPASPLPIAPISSYTQAMVRVERNPL